MLPSSESKLPFWLKGLLFKKPETVPRPPGRAFAIVSRLDDFRRAAVDLYFEKGLSPKQTSAELGVPPSTVRRLLRGAIEDIPK